MTSTSPPSARDWEHLVRAIERGSCVLVLGPEAFSIPSATGDRIPIDQAFAAELLTGSGIAASNPGKLRPLEVAQGWLDRGGRRFELEDRALDFYRRCSGETSDLHRALAKLPFRVYLDTTRDHFLAQAFSEHHGRHPQFSHYHFREVVTTPLAEPTADRPLVYKLYGDIDDPTSLVLCESDLLFFLESVVTGTPPLPPAVEGLLRNDDNAFLFLGFGFQQWHVRLLLHTLLGPDRYARRDRHRPSLVLEPGGFYAHPESAREIAFFRHQHTFEFREIALDSFADELVSRCQRLDTTADTEPAAGAPVVFLSYRHDDAERVAALREQLHRRGIATWQDRDKLRGGERWGLALERVIASHCDYFLLCQSPSLVAAQESVVFDELRQAQQRDKRRHIDDPVSFIIPGIIEACAGMEALRSSFHMPDLTSDEGIERLCDEILDDWAGRRGAP